MCLRTLRLQFHLLNMLNKSLIQSDTWNGSSIPGFIVYCPICNYILFMRILKLADMVHINILTFVFKAMNKLSPIHCHNYFMPSYTIHSFETCQATRSDLFLSLKRISLYGLKSVQYFDSKLLNCLPH